MLSLPSILAAPIGRINGLLRGPRGPVILTAGAGWIGRIVAAIAQLAALRVLTEMLGVDGYGAFAVMTGLLAWFLLADLGFGAALQNHISGLRVSGRSANSAIMSVGLLLAIVMIALMCVWLVAARWAGPALLGRFGTVLPRDATLAFLAYAIMATGTGVASIAMKITFAEHRGYLAHAMTSSAALVGVLGLVVLGPYFQDHKLALALAVYQAPAWIIPTAFLIWKIGRMRAAGELLTLDRQAVRLLWRDGRKFVLFFALAALVNNIDYVILSQTVAAGDVAVYAVLSKFYVLAFTVVNSVISAYWPVSAEMIHRRELGGLRRLVTSCVVLGAVVIVSGSIVLLLLRVPIGHILSPSEYIDLPATMIPLFALYWLVRVWSDTYAMLVTSASKPEILSFVAAPQAALSLVLGYFGAKVYGLPGLMLGMTTSFILTTVWALPFYMRRLRHRLEAGEIS